MVLVSVTSLRVNIFGISFNIYTLAVYMLYELYELFIMCSAILWFNIFLFLAMFLLYHNNFKNFYHNSPTSWDSSSYTSASCHVSLHLCCTLHTPRQTPRVSNPHPPLALSHWKQQVCPHCASARTATGVRNQFWDTPPMSWTSSQTRCPGPYSEPTPGGARREQEERSSSSEDEASLWGVWASAPGCRPGRRLPAGRLGSLYDWSHDRRVL